MTETSTMHTKNSPAESSSKNKMFLIGGGVLLALIIMIGGIFAYSKMHSSTPTPTPAPAKKKIVAPTNVIPVSERPYVEIDPTDVHNISVKINTLNKPATDVDYEIEYQTDSSLEGAQGAIKADKLPAEAGILLGSCSAGGRCRYHEGVVGGTLLMKFSGSDVYAVKQEWNYILNPSKGTKFSSKDAKFQLDSADMSSETIAIVYNSPGFPSNPPGTAISDPYSLTAVSPFKGKGNVVMRATEAAPTAEIVGWDGSKWVEFPSKVTDKTVTATVDLMQLYAVIKK